MGWCAELMASLLEMGRFRLDGADPERTYRAYFLDAKRRLGAVVDLKYDPKGPAVVPFQPTATAKGILVDPNGRPVKGNQILLWMALTKEQRELTVVDLLVDGEHALYYNMFSKRAAPSDIPSGVQLRQAHPGRALLCRLLPRPPPDPPVEARRGPRPR